MKRYNYEHLLAVNCNVEYPFSRKSLQELTTCSPKLIAIAFSVANYMDIAVLKGHRSDEEQLAAYESGYSKARPGESEHNKLPSHAFDIAPYPVSWVESVENLRRFYFLGGLVKGIAVEQGIEIRWGGDWKGDNSFAGFKDLSHYELEKIV